MEQTHKLTLEAATKFQCKKEDGSYLTFAEVGEDYMIASGEKITIDVPKSITANTIFTIPANSSRLDDIIAQFHKAKLLIAKSQLTNGNWKVVEPSQDKTKQQK